MITDPKTGLTENEVKNRKSEGFTNECPSDNSYSIPHIIRKNVFTYFNIIFFIFAAVLAVHKSYNNLTFLGVVFSNTIIGIFQEIKSKRALSKLNFMTSPESKTVREGKTVTVKNDELVLDDIIILESGKQIPADAVVCEGEIFVNESLLTGEQDEIQKNEGDKLLSGSFVVSGKCRACLTSVGKEAFSQKLSLDAKKAKKQKRTGMIRSLNILIIIIGIVIIPFSAIMYMNQHFTLGLSSRESVENTVASAIGMIPEGLYLLTTIALYASTVRLAKKKTLVHDMKCIEALARADVLCVDKTGTITEPDMVLDEIISVSNEFSEDMLKDFVFSSDTENLTLLSLKNYFEGEKCGKSPIRKKEFSSAYKFSAVSFEDGTYILGAYEILFKQGIKEYDDMIKSYQKSGKRILVFARAQGTCDEIFSSAVLPDNLDLLAVIALFNPVRKSAEKTFSYFKNEGVSVRVISGDSPETASAAAIEAGVENAEKYVDVSALSEEELSDESILSYTVFGRVSPQRKRNLINSFKRAGHTVAMTGDGINDVLALKDSDCGIAMASGSDAAANAADLVLVNSDFSAMPDVVHEGRRVINNIERSASLFLVKNIFSFIMTVISLFSVSFYPLKPIQVSLVACFMIGIPSFFLALEPNESLVKGKFLKNVLKNAVPTAVSAALLVECALIMGDSFGIDYDKISTVSFIVYAVLSYMMLYKTSKPFTPFHIALFSLMGTGFLACLMLFPKFFNFELLDRGCIVMTALLLIPSYPLRCGIEKILDYFKRRDS